MSIFVNYLIQGEDPDAMETADVGNGDETIIILKRLIIEQKKLNHVAASKLKLWQVDFALDDARLREFQCDTPSLSAIKKLAIFANGNMEHVHVIVKLPGLQPEELWLNCYILTQRAPFTVKIPIAGSNVFLLKEEILKKNSTLGDISAHNDLKVWHVDVPVDDLASIKCPNNEEMENTMLLSEQFQPVLDSKLVHVIVQAPAEPGSLTIAGGGTRIAGRGTRNSIADLEEAFETTCKNIRKAPAPSDSAKSSAYLKSQSAYSIHDGRYGANAPRSTVGPPIQLFHPAFGHFLDDIRSDGDIPEDIIRSTTKYMRETSAIYVSEQSRRSTLTPILNSILGCSMQAIENDDRTKPDGILEWVTPRGPSVGATKEEKLEMGNGGSDASTQAGLSTPRTWVQPKYQSLRNATACPTFLIASAGPWFAVLAFVLVDRVIVQRLTDFIWVGIDSALSRSHVNRVARIFYALRTSLDKLKSYYENVTIDSPRPASTRYFPSITTYPKISAKGRVQHRVQFNYLGYLESGLDCVTLRARTSTKPAEDIVVKFVERYSENAHRTLAEAGLAPRLLYFGPVRCAPKEPSYDSLSMVVMAYIDGSTYGSAKSAMTQTMKATVRSELKRALELLHGKGLVFGDLRSPNVMITQGKVMLIDFDWAGVAEQVRYPHLISSTIAWPKGVQALDPIKKKHDLEMLDKLLESS